MRVHLVGSVPLPDSETVFRTVAAGVGPYLARLPDGETGVRKTWIRFLRDVLLESPAVEEATDVPLFKFVQWDGKVLRENIRLRLKPGMKPDARSFKTGYADMARESFAVFDRLQTSGAIPAGVRFQISIPTPLAPIYNNLVADSRAGLLPALTEHFVGEVESIAKTLPNERIAIQWDVCQEVLSWHGYYDRGPVPFETETIESLVQIGNAVPRAIPFGYHLCYGSPADEHLVQPDDSGVMVEMVNRIVAGVKRPIQFFHLPVMKGRTDDAFFAPMKTLKLPAETELYLGLIHHNDTAGDDLRFAAARKVVRVDGIGTECGWGRGDPARIESLLKSHARLAVQ